MKKLYKFLRLKDDKIVSENGNFTWEVGKWYKEDNISLCNRGFHASKEIGQAFNYVQGELIAEVSVKGKSIKEDDKEVWSEMKINKIFKWEKKNSVAIAVYSAELCLKNFEKVFPDDKKPREAIEAAKRWIENPTKETESAAESAARSAAWSAARSAAWSAARSAAMSAARSAESAAWSAARSAAWSAAWSAESAESAVYKKIYKKFTQEYKTLKQYGK